MSSGDARRVALFGGTGFVGSYLVDALVERGYHPVLLVRPGSEHKVRQPDRCTLVEGSIADPEAVRRAVAGADAVIYNIGVLREFPAQGITFESLHFEGARQAMEAAEQAGVRRFVLTSANGVRLDGTAYQQTKCRAERYLASTDLEWTVFRPSVLFGDPRGRMEFATQLYRDVIRSPLPAPLFHEGLLPVNAGRFLLSPVHVRDVAAAFVASLDAHAANGRIFTLGGPDTLTWKAILQTIAGAAGTTKWMLPAPVLPLKGLAALLDRFAFFPVTRDQLTMLLEGNACDGREAFSTFGLVPTPFDQDSLAYLRDAAQ